MVSRHSALLPALVLATLMAGSPAATAQYYSGDCASCAPAVAAAPIACTPIQPVYTSCYQRVPVTTYAREKRTVEVPYYQTDYEEREYTLYRPVTKEREVEVPTVSYQNVVEYRTVNRDMGRWITRYQPVPKYSPCQVDPRPGMIGWLNRTGYSFRTAFTPNYTTSREYVPNMVSCQVPVTRQVAVRGTRRVTVQETEMVAERRTERVPVRKLAYRKEEVTVMRPQTAYRDVPIGTSMAYGPSYGNRMAWGPMYGGTAMAWGVPIIESDRTQTALSPTPDPLSSQSERRADRGAMFDEDQERDSERRFQRSTAPEDDQNFQRSSLQQEQGRTPMFPDDTAPAADPADANPFPNGFGPSTRRESDSLVIPVSLKTSAAQTRTAPSKGWKAADRRPVAGASAGSRLRTARLSLVEAETDDN